MSAEAGLAAVALADHDNIDGIPAAREAGQQLGVEVISGVELSVVWEDFEDIHLLGYGFDPENPTLRASLAEFQAFREGRNEQVVERVNVKLAEEGREPLDFGRVRELAGGTVGRPHIAQALMAKGYVSHTEEAFSRYLVPCNVPKRFFPAAEAIDLIHAAGGVAVLAHPPYIARDRRLRQKVFDALAALGLDGIEAWNTGADNDEVDWTITQARRRNLIVTGGTDFHGLEGEAILLGGSRGNLKIPYSCVEEIRERLGRG